MSIVARLPHDQELWVRLTVSIKFRSIAYVNYSQSHCNALLLKTLSAVADVSNASNTTRHSPDALSLSELALRGTHIVDNLTELGGK
jgi:hypothetical protein